MHSKTTRIGVTLPELLVVVAIIGLLVAMFLPAIQSSRAAARKIKCVNRMRQIGLAMTQYTDVRDGKLPELYPADKTEHSWFDFLAPFMKDSIQARVCPDDPKAEQHLRDKRTSYSLNGYLMNTAAGCIKCHAFPTTRPPKTKGTVTDKDEVAALSKTISFFEGTTGTEHVDAFHWFIDDDSVFKRVSDDVAVKRHGEVANYLYLDGHVRTISVGQIRTWCDKPWNFALPAR